MMLHFYSILSFLMFYFSSSWINIWEKDEDDVLVENSSEISFISTYHDISDIFRDVHSDTMDKLAD